MDLDLLLRLARLRNLAVILAAIGLVCYGNALARYPRAWYLAWRYPPVKDASGQGSDILEAVDRRKSLEVAALYGRVTSLLAQAAARGLPVAGLQKKADVALQLNRPGYRAQAERILSQIELEIPRKHEAVAVADPDQADLDLPRRVKAVAVRHRRRKRR